MKKFIVSFTLILSTAILLTSCKKEKNEPDPTSYISFKMDGVQKTFKAKAISVKVKQDNIYGISFSAFKDTVSAERMVIEVAQRDKEITTGTYVDPGPDAEDLLVVAGYLPASQDPTKIYSAGLQVDNNPRLTVTITTLTATNVSGTFSGTFYDNDGDGPGTAAVTEGKFDLPLYSN
jgi:hypothetical protein